MKVQSLQNRVLSCNITNRAETDYWPQPLELHVSFPYLQKPNKTKGSENAIWANS